MPVKGKNQLNFKQCRNEINNQRIKTTARKEKQEGPTYQSNVGLNLEQSALSPDVRAFFEDQTPSLDPDKWKDMFFKPVVDIRDFVQRKVRSTRRKRRCIALRRILFSSPMNLTEQVIITLCKPISSSDALKDSQFLDQHYQLLLTMKYKLYSDAASNRAPITKSMAEKIAGSGLSYHDLKQLYIKHGKKALITVLSKPPTASQTNKPRVTRTPRILASILKHFEHTL